MDHLISWGDFEQVDMRVGTVIKVDDFPKAKNPAYQLTIDFGPEIGIRKSSAQITAIYQMEELVGKQIVAVINFPKKQIANFMSECLVTGFENEQGEIVITTVERTVPNGAKLK